VWRAHFDFVIEQPGSNPICGKRLLLRVFAIPNTRTQL
jgi:hypothetical protein